MLEGESKEYFAELPTALVEEVLDLTTNLGEELLHEFDQSRLQRETRREQLREAGILRREADLPYIPPPTTCGIDGAYAIERLMALDLAAVAALAVEGLTPPSEKRFWPEPRHLLYIHTEKHEEETGTIARAVMIGMELSLAVRAPHEIVFIDGSLTTPVIYFNQALNKVSERRDLHISAELLRQVASFLEAYRDILAAKRSDRCWVGCPKYTTRREIGNQFGWPSGNDDRAILTGTLEPGEFTAPRPLQQPNEPWHLNPGPIDYSNRPLVEKIGEEITRLLSDVKVIYYRPSSWLPALRLEVSQSVTETPARLAQVIHGVRHQCSSAAILEPYPLYMADRMVKHLAHAIPSFRQIASQHLAEMYEGNIDDVFLGLHGYRTESGR